MKSKELILFEHKCRMKEIEARRLAEIEVENLRHQNNVEFQKLKSASIQGNMQRRGYYQ